MTVVEVIKRGGGSMEAVDVAHALRVRLETAYAALVQAYDEGLLQISVVHNGHLRTRFWELTT